MGVQPEPDKVRDVPTVDVRVPLTRRLLASRSAVAAIAQLEVPGRLVSNRQGGKRVIRGT